MQELQAYKDQHGNVDVPLKYQPNLALGAFVGRQRTEYRKLKQGLQSTLNDKRIQDLENLGFNWSVRVSRTPWEARLKELKEFKAEYGHTNVPSIYPENQPLAYWVFKQRGQHRVYMYNLKGRDKKVACHITAKRIALLDELGFEWNPPGRIKLTPTARERPKIQHSTKVAAKKDLSRSSVKNKNPMDLKQLTGGEEAETTPSEKEQRSFRVCQTACLPLIGKLVKAKNDHNEKAFKETVDSINSLPPSFLKTYPLETMVRYGNEFFKSSVN